LHGADHLASQRRNRRLATDAATFDARSSSQLLRKAFRCGSLLVVWTEPDLTRDDGRAAATKNPAGHLSGRVIYQAI
jgi:hypothetical protein